jgi:hypothetical protein
LWELYSQVGFSKYSRLLVTCCGMGTAMAQRR